MSQRTPGPAVLLRPFEDADAAATLKVFTAAILETASADYSAEQVEAWARPGRRDLAVWREAMRARDAVVATVESEVVGFSDVSASGYIDMMFVSPRHARRGVARLLLAHVEARARREGVAELSSDVSITARPFFERHGFVAVAEQHPVREGVELTNHRMVKALR